MEQLVNGNQIGKNDLDGHLQFFVDLLVAEATAQQMGQRANLDNRDRVAKMVESRLKYFADEYYEKDIDLKMSTGKGFDFGKLRETVDIHIRVLQQKQLMLGPQALKEDSSSTSLVEEPNQGCKREPQRSFSQVG